MPKFFKKTKALATRSLSPTRTVEAEVSVIPPQKGGELGPLRGRDIEGRPVGGQLAVPGKAGKTVVISDTGDASRKGSGEIRAMNEAGAGGSLKGLVKASDAVRVAASFGGTVGAIEEAMQPYVLSWKNKRVRQKLAEGGSIQRRAAGTGFGKTSAGGGGGAVSQSSEDFAEVVRKRWQKKTPSGGAAPLALPGKASPLALPGKAVARGAGASGFAVGGQEIGASDFAKALGVDVDPRKIAKKMARTAGTKAGKAILEAGADLVQRQWMDREPERKAPVILDAPGAAKDFVDKTPVVGAAVGMADSVLGKIREFGAGASTLARRPKEDPGGDLVAAYGQKLKVADVKKAFGEGRIQHALNLIFTSTDAWLSESERERANRWVKKELE